MASKKIIFSIIIVWILIICTFVFVNEYTLKTGEKVFLETIPVDPRDLLRGDYVILNYKISQLPPTYNFLENNKTIYIILKIDKNNIGSIDYISEKKPKDKLFIKGQKNSNSIKYGIESYFVKEGTGKELQQNLRNGTLVEIALDKNGAAKVIGFSK